MQPSKKITIMFDARPLLGKKTGVGFLTERLLVSLATTFKNEVEIIGLYSNFLGRREVSLPQLPNIRYECNRIIPSKLINIFYRLGIEIPIELLSIHKVDFIIYPNFVGFKSIRNTPSANVIHDLGYLDCPEFVESPNQSFLRRYVPKTIKRSRFILAVSETTKLSIVQRYKLNQDQILVTLIPPDTTVIKEVKPNFEISNYILMVGTLEPRKNFINLVNAYMLLPQEIRRKYALVLTGDKGWKVKKEIDQINDLQNQGENILLTGYVSQAEKAWLLRNADVLVQPSLYEGFGMPIIEAMASKTPTIVSDIPVFKEISGNASLFFDPKNPTSIASVLQKILNDKKLREKLVINGTRQVSYLKWDDIARNVYARIVQEINNPL